LEDRRPEERRARRRFERSIHVSIGLEPEGEPVVGRIRNISLAGAFIEMSEPVPQGSRLRMELVIPSNGDSIRCRGVVMWTDTMGPELGVGVKLRDISPEELDLLADYLGERV
jgi:hypothetical protein